MKLRATATPSATPTPVVPLKLIAAATAAMSASMTELPVIVTETAPTLFSVVPSALSSIEALAFERMTLVDSDAPPEIATDGLPIDIDAETATAIDVAVIVAAWMTPTVTSLPPVVRLETPVILAVTSLAIVLWASERPIASANDLLPERLALTETAWASAVIAVVSDAVTETPPSVVATLVEEPISATIASETLLSVQRPPALSATPVLPTATATAVAWTTAVIVAVPVASTLIPWAAESVVFSVVALTSTGFDPPNSFQPMKLRASEKPIATAGVVPGLI